MAEMMPRLLLCGVTITILSILPVVLNRSCVDGCNRPDYCDPHMTAPNPDDCASYYMCDHSAWVLLDCSPGTEYDSISCGCITLGVTCLVCPSTTLGTTLPSMPCSNVPKPCANGVRYPDQSDCSAYYPCADGILGDKTTCEIGPEHGSCTTAGVPCAFDIEKAACVQPDSNLDCSYRCLTTEISISTLSYTVPDKTESQPSTDSSSPIASLLTSTTDETSTFAMSSQEETRTAYFSSTTSSITSTQDVTITENILSSLRTSFYTTNTISISSPSQETTTEIDIHTSGIETSKVITNAPGASTESVSITDTQSSGSSDTDTLEPSTQTASTAMGTFTSFKYSQSTYLDTDKTTKDVMATSDDTNSPQFSSGTTIKMSTSSPVYTPNPGTSISNTRTNTVIETKTIEIVTTSDYIDMSTTDVNAEYSSVSNHDISSSVSSTFDDDASSETNPVLFTTTLEDITSDKDRVASLSTEAEIQVTTDDTIVDSSVSSSAIYSESETITDSIYYTTMEPTYTTSTDGVTEDVSSQMSPTMTSEVETITVDHFTPSSPEDHSSIETTSEFSFLTDETSEKVSTYSIHITTKEDSLTSVLSSESALSTEIPTTGDNSPDTTPTISSDDPFLKTWYGAGTIILCCLLLLLLILLLIIFSRFENPRKMKDIQKLDFEALKPDPDFLKIIPHYKSDLWQLDRSISYDPSMDWDSGRRRESGYASLVNSRDASFISNPTFEWDEDLVNFSMSSH